MNIFYAIFDFHCHIISWCCIRQLSLVHVSRQTLTVGVSVSEEKQNTLMYTYPAGGFNFKTYFIVLSKTAAIHLKLSVEGPPQRTCAYIADCGDRRDT